MLNARQVLDPGGRPRERRRSGQGCDAGSWSFLVNARPLTLSEIAPNGFTAEKAIWNIQAWTYGKNGKIGFNGISSGARVSAGRAITFRASTNVSRPYSLHIGRS